MPLHPFLSFLWCAAFFCARADSSRKGGWPAAGMYGCANKGKEVLTASIRYNGTPEELLVTAMKILRKMGFTL
jgi:hypothetical protein